MAIMMCETCKHYFDWPLDHECQCDWETLVGEEN